jgi:hypothetical protein
MPSERLRKLEVEANLAFDQYRELYFEGGVSSVYLWDLVSTLQRPSKNWTLPIPKWFILAGTEHYITEPFENRTGNRMVKAHSNMTI